MNICRRDTFFFFACWHYKNMVIQHQMTDFRGHFKQHIGRQNPWRLKAHGGCDNTRTYLHAVSTFTHKNRPC